MDFQNYNILFILNSGNFLVTIKTLVTKIFGFQYDISYKYHRYLKFQQENLFLVRKQCPKAIINSRITKTSSKYYKNI